MQDYIEQSIPARAVEVGMSVGTFNARRPFPIFRRVSRIIDHGQTVDIWYASGSVLPEVLPATTQVLVKYRRK